MVFRRKKKSQEPEGTTEVDQTLVAEEPSAETKRGFRFGLGKRETPGEAAPEPDLVPVPVEPYTEPVVPTVDVPEDLRPYVAQEDDRLVLREYHFTRPQKKDAETRLAGDQNELAEARWVPHKHQSLRDVERGVDDLHWKPRYKAMATGWLRHQARKHHQVLEGLERVPPNILDKRIVYETEGGFVVEVTYRELGEVRKKYFTVDGQKDRRKALESVRTGSYARTTIVTPGRIEALRAPKKGRAPLPPGKVNTWPIRNETDVREVEGIGDVYARRLNELGIITTDQFRLTSAAVLSNHLGVSPKVVEKWQQMAELLTVPGIGKQYSEVLVRSGITSIDQLRASTPKAVAGVVNAFVDTLEGGATHVRTARTQAWIRSARALKKKLQDFPTSPERP